ncbi:NF-kappa-B inhibitor-interacting Ras-like protein 1 isoform X2 [Biomphalaria glabrata]|uniref:NF-kappa-B inhibitor-interacting Ras-like protein 1 isoform X2 n=1 Tax=Biomphalaria glabrata TaxID=6526 RepID=A0A9W3AZ67_BIOGL|nr:NF-kappa-B inhibitor-interacting Ras-like protein 1 isoform X2 [Biomphalaria glabrata]
MGKSNKILLCGCSGVGKTAILEQLLYGNHIVESDGNEADIPKHYLTLPDGFILVYDATNFDSFKRLDKLKKEIDKHKDKREGHVIVIGNKSELNDRRQVQFETAMAWSSKEKMRLWEVTVTNRKSLVDPFVWLTSKITQPTGKSNFLPGRKTKSSSSSNLDKN